MKTNPEMEDTKPSFSTAVPQPEINTGKRAMSFRTRCIVGVSLGIVITLVVTGVVIFGIYFGTNLMKESEVDEHTPSAAAQGEEEVRVRSLQIIRNVVTGLIVLKNQGDKTCFVSNFSVSGVQQPMSEMHCNRTEDEYAEEPTITYTSTGLKVQRSLLSPKAQAMCDDSNVVWAVTDYSQGEVGTGRFARNAAVSGCCPCCCCCGCKTEEKKSLSK